MLDHVRKHCIEAGRSSLAWLDRGTVSKILDKHEVRLHKIRYYLERRDDEFERKLAEVRHLYREVSLLLKAHEEAIKAYLARLNETPVLFRWTFQIEDVA